MMRGHASSYSIPRVMAHIHRECISLPLLLLLCSAGSMLRLAASALRPVPCLGTFASQPSYQNAKNHTSRESPLSLDEDSMRCELHDVWGKLQVQDRCAYARLTNQYDAGVLGGVLLHQPFLDAIGNPTATYTIPMIVASYDLAACVTAVGLASFSFRLGRRGTVVLGNIVAIVGSILQASAYSIAQLIVGRLCTGFAIGAISSAVPTYLSETGIEIGDRGPANALNAILLISGVPLAYWIVRCYFAFLLRICL